MISRKTVTAVVIIFILLLVGIPAIWLKYKKPVQHATIVTGLTEGQQKIFQQDLVGAMSQYGHIKKGDRLLAKGNFDDALKEYQIALSMAKSAGTKGEALHSIANLYEKKRDYKKALEYMIIETDKYVADWAKGPFVERCAYLKYASAGDYEKAIEHAQRAIDEEKKLTNIKEVIDDHYGRLNDLKTSRDYILNLKKK